ncbi:MAG: hypothetical protein KAH23_01690 [Kiritimatiellae bacterium]|nr:hypothetical protein [Kiritimatiellia bacterium]
MLRLSTGLRTALLGGTGGDDFQGLFNDCIMHIYSGLQPASADAVETGDLLAKITLDANAYTPDTGSGATNGLAFDDPTSGYITKAAAEVWKGLGLTSGNAGWFRLYKRDYIQGLSVTGVRLDGSIATSGGQITMANGGVSQDIPILVNTFVVNLPSA